MADEKDVKKDAPKEPAASRPETAEELLLRAAELLERRGGLREKTYRMAAAEVRALLEKLERLT